MLLGRRSAISTRSHASDFSAHSLRSTSTGIRFDGLYEKPCVAPNDNVKGKERMLIKAIPEHRIQSIKYVTVKLDGEQSINYPTLASS
jgi:hypothetical protein